MRDRRRYIAVSLLSCLLGCSVVSSADAGPLLDWLFQRNRSRGLATTAYRNPGVSPATTPQGFSGSPYGNPANAYANSIGANPNRYNTGYAPNKTGSKFGCCLFGGCLTGKRGGAGGFANANQNNNQGGLANRPNTPNATTAGFAPQGSCGPGWCQQTVVRYVPQVAYRTVSEPVPVTTYKTSTTTNPSTGLPMTCTRPCTTYSYQARRVPYTTYQPVYTTVPVGDPLAQNNGATGPPARPWNPAANPASQLRPPAASLPPTLAPQQASASGYNAPPFASATPPYTAGYGNPGCTNCQNNNAGYAPSAAYGNNAAGYTPGNAANFPAAPGATPWTATGPNAANGNAPNPNAWNAGLAPTAGAWQPAQPNAGPGYAPPGYAQPGYATQTQRPFVPNSNYGASPWAANQNPGVVNPSASATPSATPWQNAGQQQFASPYSPRGNAAGASPWRPTNQANYPPSSYPPNNYDAAGWGRANAATGASPWQPATQGGGYQAAPQAPANFAPSSQPFGSSSRRTLRPTQRTSARDGNPFSRVSAELPRRDSFSDQQISDRQYSPSESAAYGDATGYDSQQYAGTLGASERMFSTPGRPATRGDRPHVIDPPADESAWDRDDEARRVESRYKSRAVRDTDREKQWQQSRERTIQDRTSQESRREQTTRSSNQSNLSRYASTTIDWPSRTAEQEAQPSRSRPASPVSSSQSAWVAR